MKTPLATLCALLLSAFASARIDQIQLSTWTWQSYAAFCGGDDIQIRLSNNRSPFCSTQISGSFNGGSTVTWINHPNYQDDLGNCRNFPINENTKVQVITTSYNDYCPRAVTVISSNGKKFESRMQAHRYDQSNNGQEHPVETKGIRRIVMPMENRQGSGGQEIRVVIENRINSCTVERKNRIADNEFVTWVGAELRDCAMMHIDSNTRVRLETQSLDEFEPKDLEIYMDDTLTTNWRVNLGPWPVNRFNFHTNNQALQVQKVWPRDGFVYQRSRQLVCPTNAETSCPVSQMYAYRLRSNDRMNCFFECPLVTSTIFSVNPDDTDNTGHTCLSVDHHSRQYDWCCRTKRTSSSIPHCDVALRPYEEPVNDQQSRCPENGCPIAHLEGRPSTEYTLQSCQAACRFVNQDAGFRCIEVTRRIPKTTFCCNSLNANTTLQQCSSLNNRNVDQNNEQGANTHNSYPSTGNNNSRDQFNSVDQSVGNVNDLRDQVNSVDQSVGNVNERDNTQGVQNGGEHGELSREEQIEANLEQIRQLQQQNQRLESQRQS